MKFLQVFLLILSFHMAAAQKQAVFRTLQGTAQGTTFRISYENKNRKDYTVEVDSLFKMIDQSMSLWVKNSLINRINNNQPYDKPDPHFIRVFDRSLKISALSDGYFDMTVGPLVRAWGFGSKKNVAHPSQAQVDSMLLFTGYKKIKRSGNKIIKNDHRMEIDFNAIAQGYSVDVMGEFLDSQNIHNWLVEIGGEVRARGVNAEGKPWRVGIEKPGSKEDEEAVMQVVASLSNRSLGTSGSYRKFFEKDGKKYSHSIDPFTGKPVSHSVLSITVLAKDCISADAMAKGFLVMGLEKAKVLARKNKADFFAIYEEAGKLHSYATPGFQKIIVD